MPLNDGYGVLIGTIQGYYRDPPDNYGNYYHGNLKIQAPRGLYHCAIDVDSHQSNTGVEWRTVTLRVEELSQVLALRTGYHALASIATSGAIDYIRSPMFQWRLGCLAIIYWLFRIPFDVASTWKRGTSLEALADLEPLVNTPKAENLKALLFGEPFRADLGMHNIHQNQGDPISSPWAAENGIWQDGITILQQSSDTFVAFMNKFTTQAYRTDDQGRPA